MSNYKYNINKILLNKISIFHPYYKKFNDNSLFFLNEIIEWDALDISKKLKLNFIDSYKLIDMINLVKKYLENGNFSEIYSSEIIVKENNDLYDFIPIVKLNLSNRSFNFLMANSITNFSCILKIDEDWLVAKRGIGKKSIEEILLTINNINKGFYDELIYNFISSKPYLKKTYLTINDFNLCENTYKDLKNKYLINVDDFINYTFSDFEKNKLIGKKSLNEIFPLLKSLKDKLMFDDIDDLTDMIKNCRLKIKDYAYRNICISNFNIKILDYDLLLKIKVTNQMTMLEFSNAVTELCNLNKFSTNELKKLLLFFNCYLKNKKINVFNYLSEIDIDIINKRNNGITLEEIGKIYNLTREGIRQKENKAYEKLKKLSQENDLDNYLLNEIFEKDSITSLDKETYDIIFPILNCVINVKKICINNDFIFITEKYYAKCYKAVDDLSNDIDKFGFVFKSETNFDEINPCILDYLLEEFMIEKSHKTYFKKGGITNKIISYIKRFGEIDLSNKNFELTLISLNDFLNVKDFNKHNFESSIARHNIISIGNGKYKLLEDMPNIQESTLDQIINMINVEERVSCKDIINKFKNVLPMNITDKMLYFCLKEKFGNNFEFGGRNLRISKKGVLTSNASAVYKYIIQRSEPTSIAEIMSFFKIDKVALSVIRTQNSDLFLIDNINIWAFSKMDNLNLILKYMELYVKNKQSFYISDFYRYIKNIYKDLLENNQITSLERFHNLIKKKMSDSLKDFEYDNITKKYFRKSKNINSGFDFDF